MCNLVCFQKVTIAADCGSVPMLPAGGISFTTAWNMPNSAARSLRQRRNRFGAEGSHSDRGKYPEPVNSALQPIEKP